MNLNYGHHPRTDLGTGPMGYGAAPDLGADGHMGYGAYALDPESSTDAGQGDEAKAQDAPTSDEAQVMALVEWLKSAGVEVLDGESEATTVLRLLTGSVKALANVKTIIGSELQAPPTAGGADLVLAMVDENRKMRKALTRAVKLAARGEVPSADRLDRWRDALTRPWMVPFIARVGIDKDGVPFISFADERPENHS